MSIKFLTFIGLFSCCCSLAAQTVDPITVEANLVAEVTLISVKTYTNPFTDVALSAVVTQPNGKMLKVPMFWAGDEQWSLRYASDILGEHTFKTECSDTKNKKLHGIKGKITVTSYNGNNPLYQHGPIRIASDKRHFEHQDGTPYLWLADTWWKGLCKRMTWEGFQILTADRKSKGFNTIQIVCGPYPDEDMLEERWENEGGKPYEKIDFSRMNPKYFEYADRRIQHLIDNGIVPVIVGGWGRPQGGGESTLMQVGLEGYKRHWRNLVARYGAYPTVWMIGGEASDDYGPWSEVAQYVKDIDPFERVSCYHAPGHPRTALKDNSMFDFDMLAIGHDGMKTVDKTFDLMRASMDASPKRPIVCGEACYEGHMQTNRQVIQRYMFWSFMLSGAAGHTYGAAGIWHAGVEGDPGHTGFKGFAYDYTTWEEGMNYPGSAQIGIGKKLLEQYPWYRFESHPEWVEEGNFAAGIPGEVRIIYLPQRGIYDWEGRTVKDLDPRVNWHAYYFDPGTGRKFDQGIIKASAKVGEKLANPVAFNKTVPSPQDWVLVLEKVSD
ncbi:DUF4038 domain-containing protein [Arenibacter sp. TNZ]|jgi:hypothetical protein|uniref:apiosidase-like domain-containing protein n=1 Tax=Arenibacter TaxID=178469 RepID=UPI000CD48A45|nr:MULTISPECIES: DUF4038 domain-containing protein [Arenibacter]MCM4174011.1 DUF4038 domain-containing protein [Arenibacter sp. TNZ]